MTGRSQPTPGNSGSRPTRVQALEADLLAVREQLDALIAERDQLRRRLAQPDPAPAAEIEAAVKAIEKLSGDGYLRLPDGPTLGKYIAAVAERLSFLADTDRVATARINELEGERSALNEQLEAGESAMRDALTKIGTLQDEIDTRVTGAAARIRELEATVAAAERVSVGDAPEDSGVVDLLIDENRRLAAQIEIASDDLSAVRNAAEEAKSSIDEVRAETDQRVRAEFAGLISAAQVKRESLEAQLDMALTQLSADGKSPVVPAERVAELLNGLVEKMQGGLEGLRIHEGEVKLRVGIEGVGDRIGIVIPSVDSPPEARENLQEMTFRFDRRTV